MFINLVAPINQLGYGVVGLNILKALVELGHTVSLFPIGEIKVENSRPLIELVQKCVSNAAFFMPDAPSIRIWHQHDLAMFPGKGRRIGWPIFELDKFTDQEGHHLSNVDELWVCSKWAKDVIVANHIGVPTKVVPLGVDHSVFYRDAAAGNARPYDTRSKTVFINVGKWEVRKGHNELLEAFNKAFEPTDNVELLMVNDNPFIGLENEQWAAKYITSKNGALIKIMPRVQSQNELRALFNQVDWGVFPSHAEGWNLEPLELMACGVPSILTDYSGHTQFASELNSLRLPITGKAPAIDGKWFNGQGHWASFSVDTLASLLKRAHHITHFGQHDGKGHNEWSDETLKSSRIWSWENTARLVVEELHAG